MNKSLIFVRLVSLSMVAALVSSCATQPYASSSNSPRRSSGSSNSNAIPALVGVAAIGGLVYAAKKHSDRKKKKRYNDKYDCRRGYDRNRHCSSYKKHNSRYPYGHRNSRYGKKNSRHCDYDRSYDYGRYSNHRHGRYHESCSRYGRSY